MIRRELAKDPKLANESWDRFLPKFRKRHLKTSEKTAKKNEKLQTKAEARTAAGLAADVDEAKRKMNKEKTKKRVYTPFPPQQQPRKVRSVLILRVLNPARVRIIFRAVWLHYRAVYSSSVA
jgi:ribosomal RNA assembly protein